MLFLEFWFVLSCLNKRLYEVCGEKGFGIRMVSRSNSGLHGFSGLRFLYRITW